MLKLKRFMNYVKRFASQDDCRGRYYYFKKHFLNFITNNKRQFSFPESYIRRKKHTKRKKSELPSHSSKLPVEIVCACGETVCIHMPVSMGPTSSMNNAYQVQYSFGDHTVTMRCLFLSIFCVLFCVQPFVWSIARSFSRVVIVC